MPSCLVTSSWITRTTQESRGARRPRRPHAKLSSPGPPDFWILVVGEATLAADWIPIPKPLCGGSANSRLDHSSPDGRTNSADGCRGSKQTHEVFLLALMGGFGVILFFVFSLFAQVANENMPMTFLLESKSASELLKPCIVSLHL